MGWRKTSVVIDGATLPANVKREGGRPLYAELTVRALAGSVMEIDGDKYRLKRIVDVGGLGETFSGSLRKIAPPPKRTYARRAAAKPVEPVTEEANDDDGESEPAEG